jgi:hypothetical protein
MLSLLPSLVILPFNRCWLVTDLGLTLSEDEPGDHSVGERSILSSPSTTIATSSSSDDSKRGMLRFGTTSAIPKVASASSSESSSISSFQFQPAGTVNFIPTIPSSPAGEWSFNFGSSNPAAARELAPSSFGLKEEVRAPFAFSSHSFGVTSNNDSLSSLSFTTPTQPMNGVTGDVGALPFQFQPSFDSMTATGQFGSSSSIPLASSFTSSNEIQSGTSVQSSIIGTATSMVSPSFQFSSSLPASVSGATTGSSYRLRQLDMSRYDLTISLQEAISQFPRDISILITHYIIPHRLVIVNMHQPNTIHIINDPYQSTPNMLTSVAHKINSEKALNHNMSSTDQMRSRERCQQIMASGMAQEVRGMALWRNALFSITRPFGEVYTLDLESSGLVPNWQKIDVQPPPDTLSNVVRTIVIGNQWYLIATVSTWPTQLIMYRYHFLKKDWSACGKMIGDYWNLYHLVALPSSPMSSLDGVNDHESDQYQIFAIGCYASDMKRFTERYDTVSDSWCQVTAPSGWVQEPSSAIALPMQHTIATFDLQTAYGFHVDTQQLNNNIPSPKTTATTHLQLSRIQGGVPHMLVTRPLSSISSSLNDGMSNDVISLKLDREWSSPGSTISVWACSSSAFSYLSNSTPVAIDISPQWQFVSHIPFDRSVSMNALFAALSD